jgi:hypothetical protein
MVFRQQQHAVVVAFVPFLSFWPPMMVGTFSRLHIISSTALLAAVRNFLPTLTHGFKEMRVSSHIISSSSSSSIQGVPNRNPQIFQQTISLFSEHSTLHSIVSLTSGWGGGSVELGGDRWGCFSSHIIGSSSIYRVYQIEILENTFAASCTS